MRGIHAHVGMLLLAAGLCLAACGGSPAPSPTPRGSAAAGKTKFESVCANCHGPDATGMPGLGKNLVTSEFARGKTDDQLVAFISQGRPATDPLNTTGVAMPPRGNNPAFTDEDLYDIVAYIRTLEK